MNQSTTHHKWGAFLLYLLLFHSFWMGVYVFIIYPWMRTLGAETLRYALVNIGLRLLVWVVPVFWYVRRIEGADPLSYLRLRQHWRRGVMIGVAISILNLLGTMARFGPPAWDPAGLSWNDVLSTALLIGFVEEIPYRGLILRKLEERYAFWLATLNSSLLFLLIHLPGWIALGLLRADLVVTIFVIGVVMALLVYFTRSLWSAVVAHSLNDFISAVLY